jgi:thiol-disulfide isomerase/thioredoxin
MIRNIILFIILFLIFVSYSQTYSPEMRLQELVKIKSEAMDLLNSVQNKKGNEFLEGYDKYIDLMNSRIKIAKTYADEFNLKNQSKEDLKVILEIAQIAKDEQKITDIIKILIHKFPELKTDNELIQLLFSSGYILEPSECENYINFDELEPIHKIYYCNMFAHGFAESGDSNKAKAYYDKANTLLNEIMTNKIGSQEIPIFVLMELQTINAYKMDGKNTAYKIIENAKKKFSDEQSKKQLRLIEKRIHVLGEKAPELESKHWLAMNHPVSFSDLNGKVILLDFFTWHCGPCIASIPKLLSLQAEINDSDFLIIGATNYSGSYEQEQEITEEKEYEMMRDHYYKMRKINWPISMSKTSFENYGINSTPTYILIDKHGIIRDGYFIDNFAYLERKIKSLLKEN